MTSNTLTDREALYCLCHVPGFGGVTIRGLKDTFGTYLSAWRVKPQELQKSGVLTERRAEVFQESRKHESAWRKEFAGLAQKNIRVIAECDPDYPTRFFHIKIAGSPLCKRQSPGKRGPVGGHRGRESLHGVREGSGRLLRRGTRQRRSQHHQRHGSRRGRLCPQRRHRAWKAHLRSLGLRGKRLLPTGKLQNFPMPWRKTAASSRSSSREPAPPP